MGIKDGVSQVSDKISRGKEVSSSINMTCYKMPIWE